MNTVKRKKSQRGIIASEECFATDLFGQPLKAAIQSKRYNNLQQQLEKQKQLNHLIRQELELVKNDLKLLAENSTNFIARIDPQGKFLYISPSCKAILGYKPCQLQNRSFYDLYHDRDLAKIQKMEASRQTTPDNYTYTYRMRHRDGYYIWFEANFKVVRYTKTKKIKEIEVAMRDITDRVMEERAKSRSQKLAKASRLTTMEEMASGMAHEINQPLAAVINYTRGCVRYLENNDKNYDKKLIEIMEKAVAQAERAGEITHRLKSFFSKGRLYKAPEKINRIIREVVDSLKQDIENSKTKIIYRFCRKLPIIMIDKIQVQQVILNLLQNAMEAMQEIPQSKRQITIKTAYIDSMVEVIISDTGPGFTQEIVNKIYQPFFTTKPYGTGMGLPISRSIIETHNGNFFVRAPKYNKEGWVCFTLPVTAKGKNKHDQ